MAYEWIKSDYAPKEIYYMVEGLSHYYSAKTVINILFEWNLTTSITFLQSTKLASTLKILSQSSKSKLILYAGKASARHLPMSRDNFYVVIFVLNTSTIFLKINYILNLLRMPFSMEAYKAKPLITCKQS